MQNTNAVALQMLKSHGLKTYGGANYLEVARAQLAIDSTVQYNPNGKFGAELIITNNDNTTSYIRIAEGTPMKEVYTIKVLKASRNWEENGIIAGDIMMIAE